ncbi:hypothetical protein AAHZ94_08965 [Streptomyces sp. HSW2009]
MHVPVRGERIGLPAGPVERQDELGPGPFAQRVPLDQGAQLVDGLLVAAEPEQRVHPLLPGHQVHFREPLRLGDGETALADPVERGPRPERQRLVPVLDGAPGLALGEGAPGPLRQGQEPHGVHLLVRQSQRVVGVAATARADQYLEAVLGPPAGLQDAAQVQDVGAQRGHRALRGVALPQRGHDPRGADGPATGQRQQRE